MKLQWKPFAVAVSVAFAWAGMAAFAAGARSPADSAKTTAKTKSSTSHAIKMSDEDFAKTAAEGGFAEVTLGKLAEDKANNSAVKELAQRMVDDHTKVDEHLKTATLKDNLSIPTQLDSKDQTTYMRLSQLSGSAFDRAYARDMVRDHEGDIAVFRREASDGKDTSIKAFAEQTLPTLEEHLKQARQALESVSPKTATPSKKKSSESPL